MTGGAGMRIVAVCGMGIGTAVLLKMNAEKALTQIGALGVVTAAALGTVHDAAQVADVLLVTADCADRLQLPPGAVVVIDDVLDLSEISDKLTAFAGH